MTIKIINVIKEAEKTTKRNDIIKAFSDLDPVSKRIIHETMNPYRVFGIKKYDTPVGTGVNGDDLTEFFQLLDYLADRKITGNEARNKITMVLSKYSDDYIDMMGRVIMKDLRCGIGKDSIEKLYPGLVPSFGVMLAGKIDENSGFGDSNALSESVLSKKYKLNFPILAEAKYDGNRLIAIQNGTTSYLSRSGKPSDHCAGLFDKALSEMESCIGPFVLDGEVLAGSFQETMNSKKTTNSDAKSNLTFYAFDIIPYDRWINGQFDIPMMERRKNLMSVLAIALPNQTDTSKNKILLSKGRICYNMDELWSFNNEVIQDGINEDGTLNGRGEGLILKNMTSFYECDRSKNWLKWKPILTLDLKIVGYEVGRKRLSDTVGALLLEGYDENGKFIKAKCGSGLNDKDRDFFKKNADSMIGRTVEIECQEITKANGSDHYSARFPIFKLLRDDK